MKILIRYIILFFSLFAIVLPVEQSAMASESASVSVVESTKISNAHATTSEDHGKEHAGPHIPAPKGEVIEGWSILGFPITNTIFSTWIFMAIFLPAIFLFYLAIKTKRYPRVRNFGLDIIKRIRVYATELIGEQNRADQYIWLLGGLIIVIFVGNIFGLILDWFVIVSQDKWLSAYLRPIFSDLSTTLVLSLTVILVAQITAIYFRGPVHYFLHYLWNIQGNSVAEKIVSVFVGWLHFIGEFIRIGSLSVRLFLNIFVGVILISVAVYVGGQIPSLDTGAFKILTLPFWFFELLVAFLQAYIFMTLSSLYIRESLPDSKH